MKADKVRLFSYKRTGNKGGIYMQQHGKERLVYPYALYRALWDGEERLLLCQGVEARFMKFATEVQGYYFDESCGRYSESYRAADFIDTAIEALKALCHDICSFAPTHYDKMHAAHAERMEEGLLSGLLERRSAQMFADDIVCEDFSFSFVEEYGCDTGFALSIGDREYRSMMSDWSNDYNLIRHELEAWVLPSVDDNKLHIRYEDSPCTLVVENRTIHGNDRYADVAKVTFTPDEFVGGPIIFGWCKKREVLKALYLGFLHLFVRDSKGYESDGHGTSWSEYRLMAYNRLQSCIIEDYLLGTEVGDLIYQPRQRIVRSVAEMKADYAALTERLNSIFFLLNLE